MNCATVAATTPICTKKRKYAVLTVRKHSDIWGHSKGLSYQKRQWLGHRVLEFSFLCPYDHPYGHNLILSLQIQAKELELVSELDKELADIIAFFLRKEAETLSKLEASKHCFTSFFIHCYAFKDVSHITWRSFLSVVLGLICNSLGMQDEITWFL